MNDIIQLQAIDEFSISTLPVARCADGNGTLTPLFFSDHVLDIARAMAICAKCGLRAHGDRCTTGLSGCARRTAPAPLAARTSAKLRGCLPHPRGAP